ncbi:hypothetical protein [Devosia sp.]|uniref:hypothetical protein n=1 Tax=Devosia sp. TaxID=1871048 RepID=UPI001AC8822C|nr:hypothetical protein [Devosia sp.]MBN9309213.1 hypothetical protein [Devosia sp.]
MVAGLLYLAGLVATLVTLGMVGFSAPTLIQNFTVGLDSPGADLIANVVDTARALGWAVLPLVGGLAVMGFGRMLMLLGSIDRALRGNP